MLFHPLHDIVNIAFPEKFTYPFCYNPHPLSILASKQMQDYLSQKFPISNSEENNDSIGKMFGVLVGSDGSRTGFLAAYSGSLPNADADYFVPQIYSLPQNSIPTEKEESKQLQDFIFSQYEMLNAKGETRNLLSIFADTPLGYPPSGSGDCCAPKLLQYAFHHHLKPICMAEFWWGKSPKNTIRHHLNYYPSCQGRCKPILNWMLQGMDVDENPLDKPNLELESQLEIIYEDEWLAIVNKPSGMLSAPGKIKAPCVSDILPYYPVHRLDMFTSGLQILVKSIGQKADLQRMFENRQVKKCYRALLDGMVENDKGMISLPLSSDYLNRPCQRIDHEHGKTAITEYEVISRNDGRTLINLYPHTGRTHQLRIHCASSEGLGCPIVGDELYGRKSNRLYLQAISLSFTHPMTNKPLSIELKPEF